MGRHYFRYFFLLYELFAPFIEIGGCLTLVFMFQLGILDGLFILNASLLYFVMIVLMEVLLVVGIKRYQIEQVSNKEQMMLLVVSILELFFFHPMNVMIKLVAFFSYKKHQMTWKHLKRK